MRGRVLGWEIQDILPLRANLNQIQNTETSFAFFDSHQCGKIEMKTTYYAQEQQKYSQIKSLL